MTFLFKSHFYSSSRAGILLVYFGTNFDCACIKHTPLDVLQTMKVSHMVEQWFVMELNRFSKEIESFYPEHRLHFENNDPFG